MIPLWTLDARCVTVGPAVMLPDGPGGEGAIQAAEAKAVCAHCRVRPACLDWALDLEGDSSELYRSGVYGGATAAERANMARSRKQVAA
jgi:WhiB family redox-sensing transcriptional regulator